MIYNKKLLFMLLFMVLFISPAIAWITVSVQNRGKVPALESSIPTKEVTAATKEELFQTIKKKPKTGHFATISKIRADIISIDSFEVLDRWWYIVKVRIVNNNAKNGYILPMLVSKYNDSPNSINIITEPGELLPLRNISDKAGIPYVVINKYNNLLSSKGDK